MAGAGRVQDELRTSLGARKPESVQKMIRTWKEHKNQAERAPNSPSWNNLSHKTNNDSIGLYRTDLSNYPSVHTDFFILINIMIMVKKRRIFLGVEFQPINGEGQRELGNFMVIIGKLCSNNFCGSKTLKNSKISG